MLALLTVNVNQRVSVDALMEAAWGEHVSRGAASTLVSHVWRLRQLLEPGRGRRQPPSVLVNDSDGYRLVGGPSTVDSLFFAEAAAEVRDLLAAGHAQAAVRRADAALALWRGRPYGGFADADWARSSVAWLEELRGQLQERRVEGLLASGAVDVAVSDLKPLIATMPFRESLHALEMTALYRSGRGEEALQAYQKARQILLDEVGIEPGPELQELHQRILNNDPALDRRVEQRGAAPRPREIEVHLPATLTPLVGRSHVVGRLAELVRDRRLVSVIGAVGCGKTRVAVDVARSVAQDFTDGVWFVDLTAVSDLDLVVDVVVSTIGFAASAGATALQDLRRYLQTRRVLVVLDNCEHVLPSVEQIVRVTLGDPGASPECCFLTTSREPIGVDGETIWTLEPLGLPDGADQDPTAAPAVELFLQRLAAVAPALDMDERVLARAVEISVAVDGLPLLLELAASRALSHSLDDIAAQVADDPSRLSRVGRTPPDHRATVHSAIEWSYQLLSPSEQHAHRRLSVLPGAFTADAAAAVIGDVSPAGVDDLLARLVHHSLLTSEGSSASGRFTAFRQLAAIRSHARHTLADAGETRMCLDQRDSWTAALIAARPPLGIATEADWYHAIDDDYPTIRATLARHLLHDPSPAGSRIACRLSYYWYYREMMVEASRWLQLAHEAVRDGEPVDLYLTKAALASALASQGRNDLASPYIDDILSSPPVTDPERLIEVGEGLIGLAVGAMFRDEVELQVELDHRIGQIADVTQSENLGLLAQAVACRTLFARGLVEESISQARSVQQRARAAGNLLVSWMVAPPPIITALLAGKPADGIPWVRRAIADHLHFGTGGAGLFVETLANFTAQEGEYAAAARLYSAGRSETLRAAMPWPRRPLTNQLLALTRENLSPADYERAWQDGERLTMADIARARAPRRG